MDLRSPAISLYFILFGIATHTFFVHFFCSESRPPYHFQNFVCSKSYRPDLFCAFYSVQNHYPPHLFRHCILFGFATTIPSLWFFLFGIATHYHFCTFFSVRNRHTPAFLSFWFCSESRSPYLFCTFSFVLNGNPHTFSVTLIYLESRHQPILCVFFCSDLRHPCIFRLF